MRITYLVRSVGTGYSIDELFVAIQQEINGQPAKQARLVRLPYVSRGWWQVWQNWRWVRNQQAGIFHVTGDIHYAALALPAAQTVLTIHDCSLLKKNEHRPVRFALFWLFWYYWPIRRAKWVTVVSATTRQELVHYVGRVAQKAVVIPNGYAPDFIYQPKVFQRANPVVLQIGTASNKNVVNLLAALEGLSCTLILVGPLPESTRRELTHRRIDYRSYCNLSRTELIQLYVACDIVTFISTYEGFGMPIVEAQAVGRVVITADVAPLNKVADGAAHLVCPTDVPAIRQGILRLIQDDTYRQQLIERGRQNATRYTIAKAAARYTSVYTACEGSMPFS